MNAERLLSSARFVFGFSRRFCLEIYLIGFVFDYFSFSRNMSARSIFGSVFVRLVFILGVVDGRPKIRFFF